MRIRDFRRESFDGGAQASACVEWEDAPRPPGRLAFSAKGALASAFEPAPEAFVLSAALAASRAGERRLRVEAPLCSVFANGLRGAFALLDSWYGGSRTAMTIEAAGGFRARARGSPVAAMFLSGDRRAARARSKSPGRLDRHRRPRTSVPGVEEREGAAQAVREYGAEGRLDAQAPLPARLAANAAESTKASGAGSESGGERPFSRRRRGGLEDAERLPTQRRRSLVRRRRSSLSPEVPDGGAFIGHRSPLFFEAASRARDDFRREIAGRTGAAGPSSPAPRASGRRRAPRRHGERSPARDRPFPSCSWRIRAIGSSSGRRRADGIHRHLFDRLDVQPRGSRKRQSGRSTPAIESAVISAKALFAPSAIEAPVGKPPSATRGRAPSPPVAGLSRPV